LTRDPSPALSRYHPSEGSNREATVERKIVVW